ncbi:EamA family transporter [Gorillibacterium sp. sgz5001074]|uniref:EamA family transporter n=1 Tax=Gorillibacterium sp. sgz5001074 TaxID=3446695 RepID=UPI003F6645CC
MWLAYAAGAACCFGLRGILYQWTSKQPADRNVLLFGVYLCGALVALLLNGGWGQAWTAGAAMGLAMGVFSYISNSAMHKGFSVGKASIVALLSGLPPLVVVLVAFVLWGEKLNPAQLSAFAVIMGGGLLIKSSGGLSLQDWKGAQWGLLAMFTFALTDLSSKQATLWGGETLPTVAVMYLTGSVLFGFAALRSSAAAKKLVKAGTARTETAAAAQEAVPMQTAADRAAPEAAAAAASRWSAGKTVLVGMLVGLTNVSGMVLILPAFKLGVTGLVSAIIALNVLLILLYARFFLKERFKPKELAGMALALGGVLVLRLFG